MNRPPKIVRGKGDIRAKLKVFRVVYVSCFGRIPDRTEFFLGHDDIRVRLRAAARKVEA